MDHAETQAYETPPPPQEEDQTRVGGRHPPNRNANPPGILLFSREMQMNMFNIHLEELGETAILHCSGPIVRGIEAALCSAVTSQCEKQTIVLDLKRGEVVDA